jgi:hypothetical protein
LDHELHELNELHEYEILNVIPVKAGIHFRTKSYEDMFQKVTTKIQKIDTEQCSEA